ncbi:MAG: lactonase family protein [Alicyclobacillus sp.]|nr:lactonase family protein [Alicyclobacillus sp.]
MAVTYLLAGSYALAADEGVQMLALDHRTGRLNRVCGHRGIENPSYVISNAPGNLAFAVSETDAGSVVALQVDVQRQELRQVAMQETGGSAPCHLCLDEAGSWLYAANYGSGHISRFRVELHTGRLELTDVVRHIGRGPNPRRQASAHPHSVWMRPSAGQPSVVVAADLGMDALVWYRSDDARFERMAAWPCPPGSGPRHVAFHPSGRWMYVVGELTSSLSVFTLDATSGSPRQQDLSTLGPDVDGPSMPALDNTAADIHLHPNGRFLYVSNRGDDSIATFRMEADGTVTWLGRTECGGRTPRNFAVLPSGDFLVCANQGSDEVAVLRIGPSGEPTFTGYTYRMSRPTSLWVLA